MRISVLVLLLIAGPVSAQKEVWAVRLASTTAVAFSPDGKTLAVGGKKVLAIRSTDSGKQLQQFECDKEVRSIAFSPDGKTLAVADGFLVRRYSIKSGKLIDVIEGPKDGVNTVGFTNNGKRLVCGTGDGYVRIWDLSENKQVLALKSAKKGSPVFALAPDGKTIATGGDSEVHLFNLSHGKKLKVLSMDDLVITNKIEPILSLSFSADGKRLYSVIMHSSRVWEVASGKKLAPPGLAHGGGHVGVIFPDGNSVIFVMGGGTCRRFDADKNGNPVGEHRGLLHSASHAVNSIALSTDGRWFALTQVNGDLRMVKVSPLKSR